MIGLQQLKEIPQNGTTDVRDDLSRTAYPVALGTRHLLDCVRFRYLQASGFTIAKVRGGRLACILTAQPCRRPPARTCKTPSSFSTTCRWCYVHTSSVQTRVMEQIEPPIRIICLGRVYQNRRSLSPTVLHQVEALTLDKMYRLQI